MGVQEKGTGLKPESGKLRQPGAGETPPWTSNLPFPSLLQHGWITQHDKDNNKNISLGIHSQEEYRVPAGEQLYCLHFSKLHIVCGKKAYEQLGYSETQKINIFELKRLLGDLFLQQALFTKVIYRFIKANGQRASRCPRS